MPTLTDEIKEFIVKGLACFDTPSQVAEAVNANFGVTVCRQQVYRFDPGCSQPPAPRWRELHAATRQALLREVAEIGIAHKTVRLRMLDRLAHRCERNSVALAMACLEQAAKECGGIYENRKGALPQPSAPQLPEPQLPAPQFPEPQPSAVQPSTLQPAVPRKAPAPVLTAERCNEILRRWEANQNRPGSEAQNQPVTGSSRISTVPPAS